MIREKLQETTRNKIKNYPCNNVRASEIGDPCERRLVLGITSWEQKKPHDEGLQNIFDLGNALEIEVIRRIKEAGFEALTARKNFKIAKPHISGREDIMIQDQETAELFPAEIKGLSPTAFNSINNINDMLNHKQWYIRKYPAQLMTYMFNYSKTKGFFFLFNKLSGEIKIIEIELDFDYMESLLRKAERVYAHIEAETLPDMIDDSAICENCSLLHICGAKIDKGEALIDDGELEEMLLRREELLKYSRELDQLKDDIAAKIGEANKVFTASFMIDVKEIQRKGYTIPDTIYKRQNIRRIV